MAKEDDEMKERITKEMDALGYVPASVDGFSDGLLRWKLKEGMEYELGFDGWELTEMFVNSVKELQEKYTLQELLERKNGDYSKIGFSDYMETEIDTAIHIQQRENERNLAEQLISCVSEIKEKEQSVVAKVAEGQYEKADEINKDISELRERMNGIKEEIQSKKITVEDIEVLRDIEPKRKSVQNLLENEVALLPKLEKLLKDELGEKSPFEMRSLGNTRQNDVETSVAVTSVMKRDVTNIQIDKKNGGIKFGNFINKDTGKIINFGHVGLEDTIAHANYAAKRHASIEPRLAALYQVQEMIENAVQLDTIISEAKKNKSSNTMFLHKMYGIFQYDQEPYLSVLTVEEMYATDKNNAIRETNNRLYNLKNIKIAPVRLDLGFQSQGILSNDNRAEPLGAIISVACELRNQHS